MRTCKRSERERDRCGHVSDTTIIYYFFHSPLWLASMDPASAGSSRMAFSVSAKHILLSEILSVTSVMRKNSRWALSTPSFTSRDSALATSLGLRVTKSSLNSYASGHGSTEQELMTGFQDLKRLVKDIEGVFPFPILVARSLDLYTVQTYIHYRSAHSFPHSSQSSALRCLPVLSLQLPSPPYTTSSYVGSSTTKPSH